MAIAAHRGRGSGRSWAATPARAMIGRLALIAALLLAAAAPAHAAAGPWTPAGELRARLISPTAATGTLQEIRLGLEVEVSTGWKTYWRSPGDAGLAPELDLADSDNLAQATLGWPAPMRFEFQGFQQFGYQDRVIYPVTVRLERPGQPLSLRGTLTTMACDDRLCIPYYDLPLSLDLPAGAATPTDHAHAIDQWQARIPLPAEAVGLQVTRATLQGWDAATAGATPQLVVQIASDQPLTAPDVMVEAATTDAPAVSLAAPTVALADDRRSATLTMAVTGTTGELSQIASSAQRLTVTDGGRAAEQMVSLGAPARAAGAGSGAATAAATAAPTAGGAVPEAPLSWVFLAFAALMGGALLNVMPCVLPVLSIKLMSVVKAAGAAAAARDDATRARAMTHIRLGFLASAAGILTSFLIIACGLIALKLAGRQVGWGIQFQEPAFLVFLILVVVGFAANLLGVFEIALPAGLTQRLYAVGQRPAVAAQISGTGRAGPAAGAGRDSLAASFATGMVATLLATPCSAPFLGTAVGYALARGPLEILAIFTLLGIGLALPYLAVAAVPRIALVMPRPGRWMMWVKTLFGVALLGTAVWLAWVLAQQLGWGAALVVLGLAGALALLLGGTRRPSLRSSAPYLALIPTAIAAAFAVTTAVPPVTARAAGETGWAAFAPSVIADRVAAGEVVFVDVTAAWCITCKVNKARVLDDPAVAARLDADQGVVAMRGDWTNRDQAIGDYLASFGRFGIPFNVVYGPGAPDGLVLSELLTVSEVLAALDQAAGDGRG